MVLLLPFGRVHTMCTFTHETEDRQSAGNKKFLILRILSTSQNISSAFVLLSARKKTPSFRLISTCRLMFRGNMRFLSSILQLVVNTDTLTSCYRSSCPLYCFRYDCLFSGAVFYLQFIFFFSSFFSSVYPAALLVTPLLPGLATQIQMDYYKPANL